MGDSLVSVSTPPTSLPTKCASPPSTTMTNSTSGSRLLVDPSRFDWTTDLLSVAEPESNCSSRRTGRVHGGEEDQGNCEEALAIHWLPNQTPRRKGARGREGGRRRGQEGREEMPELENDEGEDESRMEEVD